MRRRSISSTIALLTVLASSPVFPAGSLHGSDPYGSAIFSEVFTSLEQRLEAAFAAPARHRFGAQITLELMVDETGTPQMPARIKDDQSIDDRHRRALYRAGMAALEEAFAGGFARDLKRLDYVFWDRLLVHVSGKAIWLDMAEMRRLH